MNEQQILQDLVSKWVSLAAEYVQQAPDVRAYYIYASSERGSTFANVYYDQAGSILFPDDVRGANKSLVSDVQRLLRNDLKDAARAFVEADIPAPTEYRVYYEPPTRKLDSQISRELIYAADPERIPERGIEYWLGERAPKLF